MFLLPPSLHAVIAKVFRQADTEESGNVPTAVVPSLAAKVLGAAMKESDMQLIRFWVEQKEGVDGRGGGGGGEEGGRGECVDVCGVLG